MTSDPRLEDSKPLSSDLERALRDLLVGEVRVKIDPTTGQVVAPDGEKSSLTGPQDPNTIT